MKRVAQMSIALILVLLLAVTGVFGFFMLTVAGMGEMPEINTPLTSTFYYRNGEMLSTRFEQNRFERSLGDMPDELVRAVIAVEDRRFYRHLGIDVQGTIRAVVRNLQERRVVEGGSTITQQLARNLFLTHERTFTRKIQEAMLTLQLERKFTKEEILEKYLNTIYFGHSAYGVEAAARTYFGKSIDNLTLAESAMLAGIPRGPAYYSPWLNFEASKKRQGVVLSSMVDAGFITEAEKDAALDEAIVLQDRSAQHGRSQAGAYYIDYLIQRELAAIFPDDPQIVYRGGLQIHTTLDRQAQAAAEQAIAGLEVYSTDNDGRRQPQAALVALDPKDGSVRALVGGRDFQETQLNRALTSAGRSPGSSFKPFVYAAALEAGYTTATTHVSEPVSYNIPGVPEPYEPSEYGNKFFNRPLRMREALALSSNVVAIKTHMDIGPEKTIAMANKLGIRSPLAPFASLPLGTSNVTPLEMATAYVPFANGGIRVEPIFINKITDSNGRIVYESAPSLSKVLDERIAYLISDMLKDVLRPGGTGSGIRPQLLRPVAAKTGTSNDHKDAYIVGYTPDLVAAVWIGNDDNSTLGWGNTGSRVAGPVWAEFMREALSNLEPRDFERPEGLVNESICPETGLLHNPHCSLQPVNELFIAGTQPTEQCRWPLCPHCPPERQWHWDGWWFQTR
jgi:penicillin-binding protein 2D